MTALNRYDFIARYYDWLGDLAFRGQLKSSQMEALGYIVPGSRILVVGGGTGWLLEEIARVSPTSDVYYVEASRQMLEMAHQRVVSPLRVRFLHQTIEQFSPDVKFDFVIANFFFDQFAEQDISELLGKIRRLMAHGGYLTVTDFQNKSWWHGAVLILMYLFFKAVGATTIFRLPQWKRRIERSPLRPVWSKEYCSGFIRSVVWTHD